MLFSRAPSFHNNDPQHSLAETLSQSSRHLDNLNRPQPWIADSEYEAVGISNGDYEDSISQTMSQSNMSLSWANDNPSRTTNDLCLAISACNIPLVEALLKRNPSSAVKKIDETGDTPLHVCFQNFSGGNNPMKMSEIASLLLYYGSKPNIKNNSGWSPIHLAAQKGALSALKFAVAYNLKITSETQMQQSITLPANISISNSNYLFDLRKTGGSNQWGICHIAASIGQASMLEFLFKMNYDMVSYNSQGQTPRQVAIHSLILHKLLQKYEILWLNTFIFSDSESVQDDADLLRYSSVLGLIKPQQNQIQELRDKQRDNNSNINSKIWNPTNNQNRNTIWNSNNNNNQSAVVATSISTSNRQYFSNNQNTTTTNNRIKPNDITINRIKAIPDYNSNNVTPRVPISCDSSITGRLKKASFLNSSGFTSLFDEEERTTFEAVNYNSASNTKEQFNQAMNNILKESPGFGYSEPKITSAGVINQSNPGRMLKFDESHISSNAVGSSQFIQNYNSNNNNINNSVPLNYKTTQAMHGQYQSAAQTVRKGIEDGDDDPCDPENTEGDYQQYPGETEVDDLEVEECQNSLRYNNNKNNNNQSNHNNNVSTTTSGTTTSSAMRNELSHCASFVIASNSRMVDHSRKKADWNVFEQRINNENKKFSTQVTMEHFINAVWKIKQDIAMILRSNNNQEDMNQLNQKYMNNNNILSRSPSVVSFPGQNIEDYVNPKGYFIQQYSIRSQGICKLLIYLQLLHVRLCNVNNSNVKFPDEVVLPGQLRLLIKDSKFVEERNQKLENQQEDRMQLIPRTLMEILEMLMCKDEEMMIERERQRKEGGKKRIEGKQMEKRSEGKRKMNGRMREEDNYNCENYQEEDEEDGSDNENNFQADLTKQDIEESQLFILQAIYPILINSADYTQVLKRQQILQRKQHNCSYSLDQNNIDEDTLNFFENIQQPLKVKKKSVNQLKIYEEQLKQLQVNKGRVQQQQAVKLLKEHLEKNGNEEDVILKKVICHREKHHNESLLLEFEQMQVGLFVNQTFKIGNIGENKSQGQYDMQNNQQTNSKKTTITPAASRNNTPNRQSYLQQQQQFTSASSCNTTPLRQNNNSRIAEPARFTTTTTYNPQQRSSNPSYPIFINTPQQQQQQQYQQKQQQQSGYPSFSSSNSVVKTNQTNSFQIPRNTYDNQEGLKQQLFNTPISSTINITNRDQQQSSSFLWPGYNQEEIDQQSPMKSYLDFRRRNDVSPSGYSTNRSDRQRISPINRVTVSPATRPSFLGMEGQSNRSYYNNDNNNTSRIEVEQLYDQQKQTLQNASESQQSYSRNNQTNTTGINGINQQYSQSMKDPRVRATSILSSQDSTPKDNLNNNTKDNKYSQQLYSQSHPWGEQANQAEVVQKNLKIGLKDIQNNEQRYQQQYKYLSSKGASTPVKQTQQLLPEKQSGPLLGLLQKQRQLLSSIVPGTSQQPQQRKGSLPVNSMDQSNINNQQQSPFIGQPSGLSMNNTQQNNKKFTSENIQKDYYQHNINNSKNGQFPQGISTQLKKGYINNGPPSDGIILLNDSSNSQLSKLELASIQGHVNRRRGTMPVNEFTYNEGQTGREGEENVTEESSFIEGDDEGYKIQKGLKYGSQGIDWHDTASNYFSQKQLISPFQLKAMNKR